MTSVDGLAGIALIALILSGRAPQSAAATESALKVTMAARALQPGELIVVSVIAQAPVADVRMHLFKQAVNAFAGDEGRWQALLGIDLDQKPGSYSLTVDARVNGRPVSSVTPVIVRPKTFPTRTLRVAPAFVNPPPALQARIEGDSALTSAAYGGSPPERLWSAPFIRPVPQPTNSSFGTRSVFNGERRSPHAGTDFLSGAGTPVAAPNAGRVVVARDLYFTGNTVIIDHGLGVFSMLAHLSRIDVHEGEMLTVGRIVGLVGATGRVTGPHLHWAFRVNGARVDALSALALLGTRPASQ